VRVLCVSAQLPAVGVHAGGARAFHLLRGLARHHELHLLSFISRESEREHVPALEAFCARVGLVLRGQAPRSPNFMGMSPPYFLREWGDRRLAREVATELGGGRHEILLAEYLESTCVLPRVLPVPAVLTHLEVQYAALRKAGAAHGLLRTVRWKRLLNSLRMIHFEREACGRFDKVFVMTREDRQALLRYSRALPVEVSPLGVDAEHFQPRGEREEPCTLAFTAYYEHQPNTDAAVYCVREILPRIRRALPECRLNLVGSHPTPEVLALSDEPGVTVTGRVPDLRPWLERATVFVAPLRLGGGMRGKVLEAMAMRRAVVSTAVGVAGLDARDGREVLIANGAADFAAKTIRLVQDRSLRERIAAAGQALVRERYDWTREVERYHRVFLSLGDRAEEIRRRRGAAAPSSPRPWDPEAGPLSGKPWWPMGIACLVGKAAGYRVESAVRGLAEPGEDRRPS
jgi:glycosyltransferase involved in cell wall biosynthesis